jgi:hypothetical protein
MWWKPGDEIKDLLTHKCGIVFLKFDSLEQMSKTLSRLNELIVVETE